MTVLITQVVYTVSPKTKMSHVPPQSFLSHDHKANKKKISFWRHSSLLDSFTPAWKRFSNIEYYELFSFNITLSRGSYDLSYFHSQANQVTGVKENKNIKTVSCEGNFGNESKC